MEQFASMHELVMSKRASIINQSFAFHPAEFKLPATNHRSRMLDDIDRSTESQLISKQMQQKQNNLMLALRTIHTKLNHSFHSYAQSENQSTQNLIIRKKITKLQKLKENKESHTITKQRLFDQIQFSNFTYKLNPLPSKCLDSLFPSHRYGPTLVSNEKNIFLIGGYTLSKYDSLTLLHKYDLEEEKWVKVSGIGETPKMNPCFHIAEIYKNHLVIVGGCAIGEEKSKKYNHEILILNLQKNEWIKCRGAIALKHHASTFFGNTLMVHGGINEKEQFSDQIHFINFNPSNIGHPIIISTKNKSDLNTSIPTSLSLAHHRLVNTYDVDPNIRTELKYDGIICFGGVDEDQKMTNQLIWINCISKTGTNNLDIKFKKWETIEVLGERPSPRKDHSLQIINKSGLLVVVGGINENEARLCDVWIFDLMKLQWSKINTFPKVEQSMGGLAGHACCHINSTIYIYNSGFVQNKGDRLLWTLETDINLYKGKKSIFASKIPSRKSLKSEKENSQSELRI